MERLQKLISACGLASRRTAEEWIAAGRVTVNGQIAVEDAKVLPVFAGRVLRKGRE